jgi:hypothetical protein
MDGAVLEPDNVCPAVGPPPSGCGRGAGPGRLCVMANLTQARARSTFLQRSARASTPLAGSRAEFRAGNSAHRFAGLGLRAFATSSALPSSVSPASSVRSGREASVFRTATTRLHAPSCS